MSEITIDLPTTQNRVLKYTWDERFEFEKRFRHFGLPGMKEIIYQRTFPVQQNPNNDNKLEPTGGGDLESQIVLIYLGLRHIGAKVITEERVRGWLLQAVMVDNKPMLFYVAQAVRAVLASGVLGFKHEATVEEVEEDPKAQPPGPQPLVSEAT